MIALRRARSFPAHNCKFPVSPVQLHGARALPLHVPGTCTHAFRLPISSFSLSFASIHQSFLYFPVVQPPLQTSYRVQRTRTNLSRRHQPLRLNTALVGGRSSPGNGSKRAIGVVKNPNAWSRLFRD